MGVCGLSMSGARKTEESESDNNSEATPDEPPENPLSLAESQERLSYLLQDETDSSDFELFDDNELFIPCHIEVPDIPEIGASGFTYRRDETFGPSEFARVLRLEPVLAPVNVVPVILEDEDDAQVDLDRTVEAVPIVTRFLRRV
jgi:hypothetical protein